LGAVAAARPWTNRQGKTIEAEFVRLEGDQVVLLVDGKEARVGLDTLSDADQAYVKLFGGTSTPTPAVSPVAPIATEEPLPDLSKIRKWTDRTGRAVQGILESVIGDEVRLKVGARTQMVYYQQLCDEDQTIVRRALESQGRGLSVPASAKDFPDQNPRFWRDVRGTSVYAILRRVEGGSRLVLQRDRVTGAYPFADFSSADQDHVRDVLAALGKSDLLPADDSIRTWRDWKGNEFTGKLDPLFAPRSIGSNVHFVTTDDKRRSLHFNALCETDREYLRQLVTGAGGGTFLPEAFTEPAGEIRVWKLLDDQVVVEGKLVGLVGTNAILRTETDPHRSYSLASFSPLDREVIRLEMEARGQAGRVPIVREDCRDWVYGPVGKGNVILGKLSGATGGYVKLLLPDRPLGSTETPTIEIPFLCLSPEDQELVRAELVGDSQALEPPSAPPAAIEVRDWSLDNNQRALRGQLLYVTHDRVAVGQAGAPHWTSFRSISPEDKEYVRRMVEQFGMARFDPPPPPAGVIYGKSDGSGQNNSADDHIRLARNEPLSYYETFVALGSGCGLVLFVVLVGAIIIRTLT
jgi:hypothetical protein